MPRVGLEIKIYDTSAGGIRASQGTFSSFVFVMLYVNYFCKAHIYKYNCDYCSTMLLAALSALFVLYCPSLACTAMTRLGLLIFTISCTAIYPSTIHSSLPSFSVLFLPALPAVALHCHTLFYVDLSVLPCDALRCHAKS